MLHALLLHACRFDMDPFKDHDTVEMQLEDRGVHGTSVTLKAANATGPVPDVRPLIPVLQVCPPGLPRLASPLQPALPSLRSCCNSTCSNKHHVPRCGCYN